MSWGDALEQVNYLNAVWAALAVGVLGYLWYGEKVFAENWRKLVGLKKKDFEGREGMVLLTGTMLLTYFLGAVVLSTVLALSGLSGGGDGALMGFVLGVFVGFLPLLNTYSYARRKVELSMIDGGFVAVAFTVMGYIVGTF